MVAGEGGRMGERILRELKMAMYTLLYLMDNLEGPTV